MTGSVQNLSVTVTILLSVKFEESNMTSKMTYDHVTQCLIHLKLNILFRTFVASYPHGAGSNSHPKSWDQSNRTLCVHYWAPSGSDVPITQTVSDISRWPLGPNRNGYPDEVLFIHNSDWTSQTKEKHLELQWQFCVGDKKLGCTDHDHIKIKLAQQSQKKIHWETGQNI